MPRRANYRGRRTPAVPRQLVSFGAGSQELGRRIHRMAESPVVDRIVSRSLDAPARPALICFSHLRWGFVWQRPQHLLARFGRDLDVYFVEELELMDAGERARLSIEKKNGVTVITPCLPASVSNAGGFASATNPAIARLLNPYFEHR